MAVKGWIAIFPSPNGSAKSMPSEKLKAWTFKGLPDYGIEGQPKRPY